MAGGSLVSVDPSVEGSDALPSDEYGPIPTAAGIMARQLGTYMTDREMVRCSGSAGRERRRGR